MELNKLKRNNGIIRSKKRVGRGIGSGKGGHTVGKGTKGQNSRRGGRKFVVGFEGGQVPLYKRLPQIGGFRNPTRKRILSVNLNMFNSFKDGDEVTPKNLFDSNLIRRIPKHGIKVLSDGEIKVKIKLSGFIYSEKAIQKINKSGSEILDLK